MSAQVFCKPGEVYAVYLPRAEAKATLDLSGAEGYFRQRWCNPRTGEFEAPAVSVAGVSPIALGKPPREAGHDWVLLIEKNSSAQNQVER